MRIVLRSVFVDDQQKALRLYLGASALVSTGTIRRMLAKEAKRPCPRRTR